MGEEDREKVGEGLSFRWTSFEEHTRYCNSVTLFYVHYLKLLLHHHLQIPMTHLFIILQNLQFRWTWYCRSLTRSLWRAIKQTLRSNHHLGLKLLNFILMLSTLQLMNFSAVSSEMSSGGGFRWLMGGAIIKSMVISINRWIYFVFGCFLYLNFLFAKYWKNNKH